MHWYPEPSMSDQFDVFEPVDACGWAEIHAFDRPNPVRVEPVITEPVGLEEERALSATALRFNEVRLRIGDGDISACRLETLSPAPEVDPWDRTPPSWDPLGAAPALWDVLPDLPQPVRDRHILSKDRSVLGYVGLLILSFCLGFGFTAWAVAGDVPLLVAAGVGGYVWLALSVGVQAEFRSRYGDGWRLRG